MGVYPHIYLNRKLELLLDLNMNRRYDNYLVKKYAPLYQDRHKPMTHTAMCWGFDVGDGWFNLINTLSYVLCNKWLSAQEGYLEIKDRLGERRFPDSRHDNDFNWLITEKRIQSAKDEMDMEAEKVPVVTQVKEKFGSLRFYTNTSTDQQQSYINFAEVLSASTCEVCGKKAKRNSYGWIRARCKEHWNG